MAKAQTRSLAHAARLPSTSRDRLEPALEQQSTRTPSPDVELGARLQVSCGNESLVDLLQHPADGFAQVVADNLTMAAIGVDPAAGSFSGSNQAMLRAMRAVGTDSGTGAGESAVSQSMRRAGAPLPAELQARLEAHFGVRLDSVRVHSDAAAAVASEAIQARAFSTGTHVLFGQGEFRPHTREGLELLAHEVTHVVQHLQQRTGAASAVENGVPVTLPSDGVEREAVDEAAAFVRSAAPASAPAPGVDTVGAPLLGGMDLLASDGLSAQTSHDAVQDTAHAVSSAPELGGGVFARNNDPPASHGTVATTRGESRAGGWAFAKQPDGSWKVTRNPDTAPTGVQSNPSVGGSHTIVDGSASTSVSSGSSSVTGRGGTLDGEYTALGASAEGSVTANASLEEGFSIKAEGALQLTVVGGKLKYTTPDCEFSILGESLRAKGYVELTAEICAAVKGEVGASLKPDGEGVSLDAGGEAFAGARAGAKCGISLEWKPRTTEEWLDVAGAFAGAEGWAGAAAAFDASFSLYPSMKAEFNFGVALGIGGSVSYGVEIHLVHTPMLMLTLVGRGAALALDAIGLTYLARALNEIIDSFWDDDAARASVTAGIHKSIDVPQRAKLINRMLNGACMDDDEQAILTVFRDSIASGEVAQLARTVEGGVLRLISKFDGEEYTQLMALLYVDAHITDIPIDDDVARKLVELGLHPRMDMIDVRRCIYAMLDGFTGDADEGSILRVLRERPDFKAVVTADIKERCLDDFNGEEYDALAGFFWLNDMLEDVDFDDDVARAVIRFKMHLAVDDHAKLKKCFDALIDGATGDDDEAAIIALLMDKPAFTAALSETDLQDALADVDGEEYEDLLVALRKGNRISFANDTYDVDDNVARKTVAAGVHTQLTSEEARKLVNELISGVTGNEDETAILRIVIDNRTRAAEILDTTELRQQVLDNCNGDEYDEAVGVFVVYNLLPNLEIDDDVARAIVRLGIHGQVQDATVLIKLIDALIDGFTGDDDEAAIIAICKDCPLVRPLLTQDKLTTILDNVDGEEHGTFLVWARQNAVIADLSEAWVELDDDDARALVDGVDKTLFNVAEASRLLRAMNEGFTGDADEARILALLTARTDLLATLDSALIDDVIDNVDGEELSTLFVLLYNNNKFPTSPLPEKFDDDAARLFIDRGFHLDTARWPVSACRAMLDKMMEGFAGDDDEARMIKLIKDRPDCLTGKDDPKINEVIACTHGEEETQLFVALFEKDKLQLEPLHADFDDDSARVFVDRGFHKESRFTVAANIHLLDKMMEGFAGDDDETRMMTILKDRTDVLAGIDQTKIDTIIDHTHGEEETQLFVLLQKAGRLTLPHDDFDDNAARAFIAEGLHRSMAVDQLVCLVDAMYEGATLNEDEDSLLILFREKPEVLDSLGEQKIKTILEAFDGDQWDQLVVYLYKIGKGGIKIEDPTFTRLDDNTARLFVQEGLHTRMNAAEIKRLILVMREGSCGDDDEDAILRILRENWAAAEPNMTQDFVYGLLDSIDGEQDDRLQAILWEHQKLPEGWELDDDVARGLIREGKHRAIDVTRARQLLDAMIAGFTGDDDEAMILELLKGNDALTNGLTTGDVDTIYGNFNGEEESELLVLLLEKGKIQLDDARVDDNAARMLVTKGKHRTFNAQQNNQLVKKLLDGAVMDEDESAILTILTDKSGEVAGVLSGVSLDDLFDGFQFDHYRTLTKRLLNANFERDTILDQHVTPDCAYYLVYNEGLTGLTAAQKGKIIKQLGRTMSQDNGRAVVQMFEQDTANVAAMVAEVGIDGIRHRFPLTEQAEIEFLIYKHAPIHRELVLTEASGPTLQRLVRGRVYQTDMTDGQRGTLIKQLVSRADDGERNAFEVLDWIKRSAPSSLDAVVTALGGADAAKALFSGAIRTDVERLLTPGTTP
jgi:hypothetical protein